MIIKKNLHSIVTLNEKYVVTLVISKL